MGLLQILGCFFQKRVCVRVRLKTMVIALATLLLWLSANGIVLAEYSEFTFKTVLADIQDCFMLPYASSRKLCIEGYQNFSDTPHDRPNSNNISSIKNCFTLPFAAKQLCIKQHQDSSSKPAGNDPTDANVSRSIEDCFSLPYSSRQTCIQKYQSLNKPFSNIPIQTNKEGIEDCFTLPYATRQSCIKGYQDLSKASQSSKQP
jgi:hypothetical protein